MVWQFRRSRGRMRPAMRCAISAGETAAPICRRGTGGRGQIENQPTFSVIVPYRNEVRHIGACSEALQRQSIGPGRYELLFVDNGSTDGTSNVIRDAPGVAVIREDKPGSYAARNAAIRRARGQFFAFTDADCVPQPDWLEQAQKAMQASGAAVAVGRRICPAGSSLGVQLLQDYEDANGTLLAQESFPRPVGAARFERGHWHLVRLRREVSAGDGGVRPKSSAQAEAVNPRLCWTRTPSWPRSDESRSLGSENRGTLGGESRSAANSTQSPLAPKPLPPGVLNPVAGERKAQFSLQLLF